MTRDSIRGFLIIIGLAVVATVFFEQSTQIYDIVLGTLTLLFICVLWYFGYDWYRNNRMAISLMPDRQRSIMYAGMGAMTVTAAAWSASLFGLVYLGALGLPLLLVFLCGAFAVFWSWQESKRYYL
jgi:TRAP-type C4-dicarboxylate transport system permease small subunit